jgi:hypothetical protein
MIQPTGKPMKVDWVQSGVTLSYFHAAPGLFADEIPG